MKEQIGLNFAAALRSFLRQDPNIILVGEIRDFETAEVAIKAAMTGHLVLSTLHTNDAPSSINRLMNMGIEPFLVATSVQLIVAAAARAAHLRRLQASRSTCRRRRCSTSASPSARSGPLKLFKGRGCERCSNTGYKGRVGLYEIMEITDDSARADPLRRLGGRAAHQGDRERHDHAARLRPAEDPRGRRRRSTKSSAKPSSDARAGAAAARPSTAVRKLLSSPSSPRCASLARPFYRARTRWVGEVPPAIPGRASGSSACSTTPASSSGST